jgi:hypothetical protein
MDILKEVRPFGRAAAVLWCAFASVALYVAFSGWRYDDPYITYRYAENIARGSGFVYNAGEYILSTTTPAFAALLAALRFAGVQNLHAAALVIGCASIGVGAWALFLLLQSAGRPWAAWTAVLIYPVLLLLTNTLSSETPTFLALTLCALAAYARGRWVLTALCCSLAMLVRGDGALLVAVLCIDYVVRRFDDLRAGRLLVPWPALVAFLVIVGAWSIWATAYFGSPFPVTLAAKRAQGIMQISTSFFDGLTGLPRYLPSLLRWPEIAVAAFGAVAALRHRRVDSLLVVWTAAYVAAYSALGVTRYFWYYAPVVPGFVLCLALGLDELFAWISTRVAAAARFGYGAAVGLILLGHVVHMAPAAGQTDPRYSIYRSTGEWLRANTPAAARLGMLEVGVIGYYADRAVVDFAGLVQPDVAMRIEPASTYDDLALYAIEAHRPDWLVLIDGALPKSEARARERCVVRQQFPGDSYAAPISLSVWQCPT